MDTPANIILFFSCLLDPGKRGLALPNGALSWYTSPPASFGLTSPFLSSHQPLCSAHMLLMKIQQIFDTTAALVLFSSATSIVRDDILYHPGLPSKFANDVPFKCTDPPFRSFTPTEVSTSISDTTALHLDKSTEWQANVKPHTLDADRQFPLLCTPYYGFVSELALDTTVALLNLANFLIACCYTPAGTPHDLYNIGDSPPSPYELLALFSYLPSDLPTGKVDVFPGTGVFICDPSSIPSPTLPTEMCWLYRSSAIPPRPTTHFPSLTTTLTPGSGQFCTPIFQDHAPNQPQRKGIPLGPHVCVHLNPGRLPPPFLDRSEKLALLHVDSGGPGARQYWHSFCPDGPQVPLAAITPATHPLPTAFSNVLLACEGWTEVTDLFPDPQRTCPSSDDTYLSLWCPDDSPLPSPDHSITICNQHPESDYPAHGASFVSVDWHHERLMVAGFGNVPTPISLIAHTSLGSFPISTPSGLAFSMTVKPTSLPSRILQLLHILSMLANLALALQPGASLHTLSLRIPWRSSSKSLLPLQFSLKALVRGVPSPLWLASLQWTIPAIPTPAAHRYSYHLAVLPCTLPLFPHLWMRTHFITLKMLKNIMPTLTKSVPTCPHGLPTSNLLRKQSLPMVS